MLIPLEAYERLQQEDAYDDGPWTREELEALAWETIRREGRENEWDEYNETSETP